MWNERGRQQGFSLVEMLFALLLFSLSYTALLHYQQALAQSFHWQWQQREAWRQAYQRLQGKAPPDWQTQQRTHSGPPGCRRVTALVISPAGRRAELTQLYCDENLR